MTNIRTILLDLDDTLLGNDVQAFLPRYFALLGHHATPYLEPERSLKELVRCTRVMAVSPGGCTLLHELFWSCFQERTGLVAANIEPFFDQFYRTEFRRLASLTQVRPAAGNLLQSCFERGLKVVIATNPMFPSIAIEQRLEWAGIPVTDYAYDLVTSYDNMHATKLWPVYYIEILDKISCQPERAMMVGDDWSNDIVPAVETGMCTFWINHGESTPDERLLSGSGTLEELHQLLLAGWIEKVPLPAAARDRMTDA
jgi:FMN phosphatase YigB (HAD superfamily)